jgi:hypothetical protein
MFKAGMTTTSGMRCTVDDDPADKLQQLLKVGHKYWLLHEDCPDDVATEVSVWWNSSNNTSQVSHEMEHIRGLQRVCRKEQQACML